MDWLWKTRGIIHEFFVANLLGNPWTTHGIFHKFSMTIHWGIHGLPQWIGHGIIHEFSTTKPLGNPWKTRGVFHEFSVAILGESMDFPE